MSKSATVCPHCGIKLSSPDKLARHLSRDCTAFIAVAVTSAQSKPGSRPGEPDAKR
ncbi:MAG: hypothetical protein GXY36_18285 [Chloroflexi bacterium]|nr:hypothetical protein [Chloroflexota bacterium]